MTIAPPRTAMPSASPTLSSIYGYPTVPPGSTGCAPNPAWPGSTAECKATGLPPGAAITLTVNGANVPLSVGPTTVPSDGVYEFWCGQAGPSAATIIVRAGGVSKTIVLVFAYY